MKKNIFYLLFFTFSVLLFSDIVMFHEVPVKVQSGKSLELVLEIRDGFDLTDRAYCYYRNFGDLGYQEIDMTKGTETEPQFSVTIPGDQLNGEGLEYYFKIIDKDGNGFTSPENQALANPYRISLIVPQKYSDAFIQLSPDPMFAADLKNPVIAVSYFALKNDLDLKSIQIIFDGKVAESAKKSDNMIIYKPKNILPGSHNYYVSAKLKNGSKIKSKIWQLNIPEKYFQMPLNISGNVTLNTYLSSLNADYLEENDNELRSNFQLNFKGNHRWLHFHSKLYFSSLERRNKQPVNRYNFGIKVPHFEVIAGDYSPDFSGFSISGKNVRGVYNRLFFNNFRMMTVFGSIRRDTNGKITIEQDESGDTDTTYVAGTFRRNTAALRLELGNRNHFLWGLNITKNKDDKNSLEEKYYLTTDSLTLTTPKDNLILGTDFRFAFADQRIVLGTEAAMSLYNSNILDGAISLDSLEADFDTEFPIDPEKWENVFVINENVQPIKPGLSNLAYKTFLRAFVGGNLLNVSYSAVGSAYNSLSANYLQNDAQTISVYDNLNLLNNSLSLNLGIKLISDNIYDEKDFTTSTINYFGNIYYAQENLPYFSFSFNNNNSKNDADSTYSSVDIKSASYTFGTGYKLDKISFAPTKFGFNFNNLSSVDNAGNTFDFKKNNITFSAKSKFTELPLSTVVSYSLSLNKDKILSQKSNYHSIYLKGTLSLMEEKLNPYLDFRYSKFGGEIDDQNLEIMNLGTSFNLNRDTYLSTNLGLKFYQNNDEDNSNYSKVIWRFKISRRF